MDLGHEPDDPRFDDQWGLKDTVAPIADIRALDAWEFWTGDIDFKIAVIDTGMNYDHSDLAANTWTNTGETPGDQIDNDGNGYVDDIHGYDTLADDGDPYSMTTETHATFVAGIIGAETDNNLMIAGVNWYADIVALRAGTQNGIALDASIEALQYSVDNNIKVSNNSYGDSGSCPAAWFDAIEAARDQIGHLFVTIAHNHDQDVDRHPLYPCSCNLDNIICVAATTEDDKRRTSSSYGQRTVDIGAPGEGILSIYDTASSFAVSGTSFAAPHITGVAALIMSRRPDWTYDIVRDRILLTARPVADLDCITVTGGVVDAGAAVWDCNDNGIADECDIDCQETGCDSQNCGGHSDCNANTLPDDCEPDEDCNNNQTQDVCDIYNETSEDCNKDRIPDECQPDEDCNENQVTDICDIGAFTSHDCNCNLVPDDCEVDCNANQVQDDCDLRHETSEDCNDNLVPDECDITGGTSYDCDLTGIQGVPDECEGAKACCDPWTGECIDTFESCCDALGLDYKSNGTCATVICPTYNVPG